MNNIESKLKTASVGGFVKKDVIAYIEGMEQEYRTKLGTLERILAATQASRSEVEQKLQAVLAGQGQESGEVQRLNTAVQDLQGNLELLKNELSAKDAELENARGELRQLSARLADQEQGYSRMLGEMNGELEQLRAKLAQAERDGAASAEDQNEILLLRGEVERLQKAVSELQAENQALREQVKAAGEAGPGASVSAALLLDLQSQLDQRNRQLIAMSEEMEQLHSRNKEYEASMAQFGSIQARAEQIEEAARKKAEEMVSAAASESSKLKMELDAWLSEMEASYAQIKQEASKSVSQAYAELEKTRAAMDELALRDEKRGFPSEKHVFEVIHGHGEARNA